MFSHCGQRIHPNPLMLDLTKLPDLVNEILVDVMWAKGLTVMHNWTCCLCPWHLPWQDGYIATGLKRMRDTWSRQGSIWTKPRQVTAWNRTAQWNSAYLSWMTVNSWTCKHENKYFCCKGPYFGVICYPVLSWQQLINTNGIFIFLRSGRLNLFYL